MNVWIRCDALNRKAGEHVQGSGVLVDIEPDESTDEAWATFYLLGGDDHDDGVRLRGRIADRHLRRLLALPTEEGAP